MPYYVIMPSELRTTKRDMILSSDPLNNTVFLICKHHSSLYCCTWAYSRRIRTCCMYTGLHLVDDFAAMETVNPIVAPCATPYWRNNNVVIPTYMEIVHGSIRQRIEPYHIFNTSTRIVLTHCGTSHLEQSTSQHPYSHLHRRFSQQVESTLVRRRIWLTT